MNPLVSTEWLSERLFEVRTLDASWYMPGEQHDPKGDFIRGRIPQAEFFDIDAISDPATDLPHMLPSAADFEKAMNALHLDDKETIVVYDRSGIFSSPRAWWMLRAMGHEETYVLDGGYPKWEREGRPVSWGIGEVFPDDVRPKKFTAKLNPKLARDYDAVLVHLQKGDAQIVDARSSSRFTGEEKEPRAGLKSGHMPGAVNLHWRALLTHGNTLKDDDELRRLFAEKGVDMRAPIVTSCGSGISAAILMLALEKLGAADVALYDGSWAEWGGREGAPIESKEIATG